MSDESWKFFGYTELHPTFYRACDYLSMLGLKLNYIYMLVKVLYNMSVYIAIQ